MANEVLLVNPRRRRGRRGAARRAAPSARRTVRRAVKRTRRRNPIGPFAGRGSGVGMYVSNPRRRPRITRRRRPTRIARRSRYRRNPAGRMTMRGIVNDLVFPAATAGAGALMLDVLWGFVPVPVEIKTGPMRHVAKGLGAVVLGQIVGTLATKRMGDTMAMGALTVVFHSAFREMSAQFMPNLPLGYYSAGANAGYDPQLGYYVSSPALETARGESVPVGPSVNSEMGYYVQEQVGAQY